MNLFQKHHPRSYNRSSEGRIYLINGIIFFLVCYFIYHSLNGERGIYNYLKLKKEFHTKSLLLTDLTDERKALETQVKLLNPRSYDVDLLDELARRDLGMVAADEKVIILKNSVKLDKKEN